MPLTKEEWDEVRDLICEIANLSMQNYSDCTSLNSRLLNKLDRLRMRHGEIPILLSTRADYIEAIDGRLSLYKRAVELSKENRDISCLTQSAESIVEIYSEDLSDFDNGMYWLNKLKAFVSAYGDKYILNNLSDLEANLNRLKIKGA